jgi:hypothetical protein
LVGRWYRVGTICRSALGHFGVVKFAPRISPRLHAEIERLADASLSAADITRAVGAKAEALGLRRPSYEQVRKLARAHRARPRRPPAAEVLLDEAFGVRPPGALLQHLVGMELPSTRSK